MVCLTWQENEPAGDPTITGFEVYKSTTPNFNEPLNSTPLPATQLWYEDTDVEIGQTYYYTVSSLAGTTESVPAQYIAVTIPSSPPPPPPPPGNSSGGWWTIIGRIISH
jgi:hypothetical protein